MPVGSSPPPETPPEGEVGEPARSGPPPVIRELKLAWQHRYLVGSFVTNDIRYRYTGGSIGIFWTVVNPLVELVTYTFVFNILLGVTFSAGEGTLHYSLFLFCGMVCWFSLAEGLTRATHSITDNAHLIKKVNFPAAVLPAHVVLSAGVNQFMRMIILALGVIFLGNGLSLHILLVPAFMVVQAGFVLGLGFLAATAGLVGATGGGGGGAPAHVGGDAVGEFGHPPVEHDGPGAHVAGLLLTPHHLGAGVGIDQAADVPVREGVEHLEPVDGDVLDPVLLAGRLEVVMQRIAIAADLGKQLDVAGFDLARPLGRPDGAGADHDWRSGGVQWLPACRKQPWSGALPP